MQEKPAPRTYISKPNLLDSQVLNWKPYLQSICNTYARWWECYTITDVVGKKRDQAKNLPLLLHDLMVEKVKQEKEEETERLTVLNGLLKYAANHVLLIGRPGSGKSTALLRLLLESAQETKLVIAREAKRNDAIPTASKENEQIPILIELRFYKTSIIDLIRDFLKRHQLWLEIPDIEKLLFAGKFLLLFDGVNELPSEAARQNLQKFHRDYQQTTPMIFTTRDLGVGGDLGIEKKLQMQPLTETQMGDFVRGYLPEQGEEMLKQLSGRLRELGETPLLLMMLCSVFVDNQNKVPSNLGSVFRRFTEIYDNKLKQDIPVTDESRLWWKRLLQHLAWVMTKGESKTEISVAIPIQQARDILTSFLKEQDYHQPRDAEKWLDDLLKHHLIQIGAGNQIQFRHQLLQEYYAAERLLVELPKLSNEQLQWDYLNYLKWTEPVALMMQLVDKQPQSLSLVKLALAVDWQLGARLAGEVKEEWQGETVGLVDGLKIPLFLKIGLLGTTKSDAAIPGLMKLLEHEDSSVRRRTAYALGKINSDTAIPNLTKLLKDEDSSVRRSAVSALVKIKSDAAIMELIKLLEDEDSSIRMRAVSALGEIKSNAAILGLIKILEHEDSSIRISAASALGEIKSDAAIPGLIKLLDHEDLVVIRRAVYELGEIKSDAAIPGLIKLLDHEDSSIRMSAASAMGKIKSDAAIPGLSKLLEDEDLGVRMRAVSALGEIKSDATIPGLAKFLEDEDLGVRMRAVSAPREIKSDATIPELSKLLEDEDLGVRMRAVSALREIKSDATIPGLSKLLEDKDSSVRMSVASALGEIKSDAAIPGLMKLLEDEDLGVRWRAAKALGEIKSDAAIPGLMKLLEDEDLGVRMMTADSLGKIKTDVVLINLIQLLNNQNFFQINNGESSLNALNILEEIQQHFKYYKPIPKPTMSKSTSHNYALLIGVGECEETKLSLPVTVKDIQAIKSLLTNSNLCGYIDDNIRLLYNETATKEQILENLTWLKQQAENDPEATILIYYSGHGCLDNSGNYYLIPHETDRAEIPDTALPAEIFNQALQAIPAQRLLVIIDSCHAQGMASSKDNTAKNQRSPIPKGFTQTALPNKIIDDLKEGTGRVVFTSSTGEQSSWIRKDGEMSIYTYHFLEALQGAGNQGGDKVVKVSHLMQYLGETVPASTQQEYNKEQTPFFDFATEDFPVALLRGGKGLPEAGYERVEAEENIRGISNRVNDGVGNVGDGNIGLKIDSGGGSITIGDVSSR